jgi:hypothetical protein
MRLDVCAQLAIVVQREVRAVELVANHVDCPQWQGGAVLFKQLKRVQLSVDDQSVISEMGSSARPSMSRSPNWATAVLFRAAVLITSIL